MDVGVIEWLRRRIEELEEELEHLRYILRILEGPSGWRPGEKPEEVRVNRKRIGVIYWGENDRGYYVRAVPSYPMPEAREVTGYLEDMLKELREMQARHGEPEAALKIIPDTNGGISEVVFEGLQMVYEVLKAKAVLKTALEVGYQIYKSRS